MVSSPSRVMEAMNATDKQTEEKKMTTTYKIAVGVEYIDPNATMTEDELTDAVDALIEAAQAHADRAYGEGAVEVVGVPEGTSFNNKNIAEDENEQQIFDELDFWVERNWVEVIANS